VDGDCNWSFSRLFHNSSTNICFYFITNAVKTIEAKATVHGDPKTKIVLVQTQASEAAIKSAIITAGYQVN